MEFLNLRLSFPNGSEDGTFSIMARSRVGETNSHTSKLPFFQTTYRWRTTLIKVLGAVDYRPEDFPQTDERDWLIETGLLDKESRQFSPDMLDIIGNAIYDALFPVGEIRQLLQKTLAVAGARHSLNIQIEFSKDILPESRIPDYPWELARDDNGFLAHRKITFSRYIAFLDTPPALPSVEQIQVLLVSSLAHDTEMDLGALDDRERQAVRAGLDHAEQNSRIRISELKQQQGDSTFKALGDYLTNCDEADIPHVIHFDGHGFFGKRCDRCRTMHRALRATYCRSCQTPLPAHPQGYLLFETSESGRTGDYVSSEEVGRLCQDVGLDLPEEYGIRLVVTSACKTGMALGSESVFNGVAQGLIKHGVPAVVAMQYNITVTGARSFAERFYRALSSERTLAAAVKVGKGGMTGWNQWYRPVLYLRWRDNEGGQLFADSHAKAPIAIPDAQEIPAPATTPASMGWLGRLPGWARSRGAIALTSGTGITAAVLLVRLLGLLQSPELQLYDHLLRMRPSQGTDERITVIEFTEEDFKAQQARNESLSGKSISDEALKQVLELLSQPKYKPSIIALDLYRDFGENEPLAQEYREIQKDPELDLFIVCEVPSPSDFEKAHGVEPPLENVLSRNYVGFSNFVYDADGIIRRHLIEMPPDPNHKCQSSQALSFLVTHRYLEKSGKQPNVDYDRLWTPEGDLILAGIQLDRIDAHAFGGYQYLHAGGVQFMLNYRASKTSLREITQEVVRFESVRRGDIRAEYFKNRIVLIGVTYNLAADRMQTPYGEILGVTVHAHMISQLLSAVLDGRPMIWVWPQWGEALWTLLWGIIGAAIGIYCRWRWLAILVASAGIAFLYFSTVATMIVSAGWLPMLPPMLVLGLAAAIVNLGYYGVAPIPQLSDRRSSRLRKAVPPTISKI